MANILFLHAHPDDEAIFTGGTIARLSAEGHHVFVAFATNGELGIDNGAGPLKRIRIEEAHESCSILGVRDITFLGYRDSGYQVDNFHPDSFAKCNINDAALELLRFIEGRNIDTIAFDDKNGIYGHPDHIKSHQLGMYVSELAGFKHRFTFTVDREYLHYLVSMKHVVTGAFEGFNFEVHEQDRPLNMDERFGSSTVEIDRVIEANGSQLAIKRKAMETHKSQMQKLVANLTDDQFLEAYRYEWYNQIRGSSTTSSPSAIDPLHTIRSL